MEGLTLLSAIKKPAYLSIIVDVVGGICRILDKSDVSVLCGVCRPLQERADLTYTGLNTLHQLQFGYMPVVEDLFALGTSACAASNDTLLVFVKFLEGIENLLTMRFVN